MATTSGACDAACDGVGAGAGRVAHNFLSALVGSFATPAAENPTVAMIEAAFRHHGLDARYINCEVQPAALGAAARGARAMGWRGFNCSIPHKVAIIAHLDGLGDSAATIGAVNCAVRRGDKLIGENTDGVGFMELLRTLIDPRASRSSCSAPAARRGAIAVELALAGAARARRSSIAAARGRELTALINAKTPAKAEFVLWDQTYRAGDPTTTFSSTPPRSASIPTSRVGSTLDLSDVKRDAIVADVIPNPPRTLFLREAEARG